MYTFKVFYVKLKRQKRNSLAWLNCYAKLLLVLEKRRVKGDYRLLKIKDLPENERPYEKCESTEPVFCQMRSFSGRHKNRNKA